MFVYKLIAADTVEEQIVELQQRIAELAGLLLGRQKSRLELEDIDYLFGMPNQLMV